MEWSARHPTQRISAFEDNNRGCIFIYKLDSDDQIRLGQRGNIAYLTDDLIYLLRIEADNKSHYIYIKSKDHFFNLHKHTHDTSKRFCPICSNTILIDEFRSHISKCYNVDTNSTLNKKNRHQPMPTCSSRATRTNSSAHTSSTQIQNVVWYRQAYLIRHISMSPTRLAST